MEYIYRNLSFVEHVALMGLEYVGYTPRNIDELWIDPFDYQDELEKAVRYLSMRGMAVSLYNHQLCVLRPSFGRMRGSLFQTGRIFSSPNARAALRWAMWGLFQWAVKKHSDHIHAL